MNYNEEIQEIIERVLTEKTFNLDIIEKIKDIRDNVKMLETENESLKKKNEACDKRIEELSNLLTDADNRVSSLLKAEADVKSREKELDRQDAQVEKEMALKNLAIDLFKTVFRNTEVRRSFSKTVPVKNNNGYIETHCESGSENKTSE